MDKKIFSTFKRGSRTYFYSSIFFPEPVKTDVFVLYSFVRTADNFVDAVPQQEKEFNLFVEEYNNCLAGGASDNVIIQQFVNLVRRKGIDPSWVDAFLESMGMDLWKNTYDTMEETITYIHGSAEVIGLMMARILDLHADSLPYAQMQGRAMQYINFIRDIAEDISFGRRYIPLAGTTLGSLFYEEAKADIEEFSRFIRVEIDRFREWQREAEKGYPYIRKRYLVPIKTAAEMYSWTADRIYEDPMVVYRKKMKPGIPVILRKIVGNSFSLPGRISHPG